MAVAGSGSYSTSFSGAFSVSCSNRGRIEYVAENAPENDFEYDPEPATATDAYRRYCANQAALTERNASRQ